MVSTQLNPHTIKIIGEALYQAERRNYSYYADMYMPCGKGINAWTYRNQELKERFVSDNYILRSFKSGPWPYLVVVEKNSGILFEFMRRERFNDLQAHPEKSQKHYSKLPATVNIDLDAVVPEVEQLSFLEKEDVAEAELLEVRATEFKRIEKLLGVQVNRYIIVTFQPSSYGLKSLFATVVNRRFQSLEEYNLGEYIPVTWKDEYPTESISKIFDMDMPTPGGENRPIDAATKFSLKAKKSEDVNGNGI